jgi:xanthine dehydrogenase small subunit
MIEFILNDHKIITDKPSGALLLDFIRLDKSLPGTKIGCREGDCGACTVLVGTLRNNFVEYRQVTSCLTPLVNVQGNHVVTIEGLNHSELSPVQNLIIEESGTQCGFCTVGFVVSLTGFSLNQKTSGYAEAIAAIDGNICRCTGYKSIERAVRKLVALLENKDSSESLDWLIKQKFIPPYFKNIRTRLQAIPPLEYTSSAGPFVSGGTDLYVQKPDLLVNQEIRYTANDPSFHFIRFKENVCHIGGGTTMTELANSETFLSIFPKFTDHLKLISSTPIRNMSSIAGNMINASPIGDLTIFFLALNARITFKEKGMKRTIDLKDLYKGYKLLDKSNDELATTISFNVLSPKSCIHFEKVSKRTHLDIASVNSAAQLVIENGSISEAHISAGGIGPVPTYLHETSSFLEGRKVSVDTILNANKVLQSEIKPISDVRGSADYKRLLMRQLFFAHFIKLFPKEITLEALV